MYFGSYTCITDFILVLRILYLCYRAYSCLADLILVFRILYLYYGSYTCFTEHVLVFQILYLYYRTCTCISDKEVPVGTTEHFNCTKVPVGTTHIHYTEVPVVTAGLILILQNLYLFFRYESTCGYYRDYSDTGVLVGTTKQIQRYIQIFTLILYSVSYHMSI